MRNVINSISDAPFPEIREAITRWQTWVALLGFFGVLSFAIHWPALYEFLLLCCFPAGLFFMLYLARVRCENSQ